MFVYVIVNSENLKIYIGQHKGNNLQKYLKQKISHALHGEAAGSHLYKAMRKYSQAVWSIHPLISGIGDKKELDETEQLLIYALKAQHPDVGYNICDGGEGFTGPHTEATKEKLRAAIANRPVEVQEALNRALSEKMKALGLMIGNTLGRGNRGNHYPKSEEFRQQVSKKLKGQKLPTDRVQKSADARRGKSHQVTPEGRIRMANMKGKKQSQETIEKRKASNAGFTHSEEAKQKMRKPMSPGAVQHMTEAWKSRPRKICPHGSSAGKCRECGRARYKKWYWSHKS
jgi:GIY-YIG catalytic domain